MLRLLKYDLKYLFKIWMLPAIILAAMTAIAAGCTYVMSANISEYDMSPLLLISSVLGLMLYVFCIGAFVVVTLVFIAMRYYRSCFTDEGYLTFTLPVKRESILGSKLIAGLIVGAAATAAVVLSIAAILLAVMLFSSHGWREILDSLKELPEAGRFLLGTSFIESSPLFDVWLLVDAAAFIAAEIAVLIACVTFGGVIVKRGKFIVSLAIFYGLNMLMSVLLQLSQFMLASSFPDADGGVFSAVLLTLWILFSAALIAGSWFLSKHLLKNKLNLE